MFFFCRSPIIKLFLFSLQFLWTDQTSKAENGYKVLFQRIFRQHSPQLFAVNLCLSQVLFHVQITSIEVAPWLHTSSDEPSMRNCNGHQLRHLSSYRKYKKHIEIWCLQNLTLQQAGQGSKITNMDNPKLFLF